MLEILPRWAARVPGTRRLAELLDRLAGWALPNRTLKHTLTGTWLGHPVHPALTDLTLGAWIGSGVLDATGSVRAQRPARTLVGVGVVSAVPTALAGLADWSDTAGEPRRIGVTHALLNTVVVGLYGLSWVSRALGGHRLGRRLALSGLGVGLVSAYLGGHLVMRKGVGVDHTVFLDPPSDWTPVMAEADLGERMPVSVLAGEVPVMLVRHGAQLHALVEHCSHRGGPLSEGRLEGGAVVCPWHASTFSLSDGSIVAGPATAPQPVLATRVRDGRIEVRAAGAR